MAGRHYDVRMSDIPEKDDTESFWTLLSHFALLRPTFGVVHRRLGILTDRSAPKKIFRGKRHSQNLEASFRP
ncbi:hypothetical protein KIN20_012814 [Parelaphostrongylus tenuis]|uniref:Uncharacterized protein n=1 Tax=Parelaphostrongylus tenuis TaxID=148309 RepID=A0AAD5MEN8_PARTN|nr:hypothetical protein KIN20_012814 [Parelaphostrongylus tenuis]